MSDFAAVTRALADTAEALQSIDRMPERIARVLEILRAIVRARAAVLLVSRGAKADVYASPTDLVVERLRPRLSAWMQALSGELDDERSDEVETAWASAARGAAHLAHPVMGPDGALGVIYVEEGEGEAFAESTLRVLTVVAAQLGAYLAISHARQTEMRVTEELRATQQLQQRFVGIVGHDIRNPLAAIKTSATLLLRHEPLSASQLAKVQRIARGAARIEHVILDLLDFTRAQQGGAIPIRPEPADLHAICRAVADELEPSAETLVIAREEEGDGRGEWDPHRLAQVISNLLSNALQHRSPDTPVVLLSRTSGEVASVEIVNQGEPISEALQAVIFDAFRRGLGGSANGLGLGLFIARAIVVAHGGAISVRSDSEGTRFTVRLPTRAATPG